MCEIDSEWTMNRYDLILRLNLENYLRREMSTCN